MKLSRRKALQLGSIGVSSLFLGWEKTEPTNAAELSPQIPRFQLPFQRPPILEPIGSDAKFDRYEIVMQKDRVEILPGIKTEVWSYIGTGPSSKTPPGIVGPLIRQRQDKESIVRFINQLGQDESGEDIDTSIHLHGMPSLPQYDGYAEDLIPPQHYKDYYYPNILGAVQWYHDHTVEKTSRNVYKGLAGMYLVDYDEDDFVNPADRERLPQGDYDVPLIIQDKRFDREGNLVFFDRQQTNLFGDVMLVNGVPWPRMEVANRKYRFRALNAGTSRTLQLSLSTKDDLIVLASDSGLLDRPVRTKDLQMGVAERYEFAIDFSLYPVGTKVFLQNLAPGNIDADTRSQSIMCFEVVRQASEEYTIPDLLGKDVGPLSDFIASKGLDLRQLPQRTFRFGRNFSQWVINNQAWNPCYVAGNPRLGGFEVWNLINPGGGWVHPVHIHLVKLRTLGRSSGSIPPYQEGWKDTFYVSAFETIRVLAEFGPHQGKYMMHCHNLVHEDHDMMTQFEVGQGGCDPLSAPARALPASSQPIPWSCSTKSKCDRT
ncbi:MAG: multicopper oxidase domain-containing protein [Cyanosarcina radialis HA8281-LM2]|jgi:FtsP/CotA-like multicopper oxidase with cupredoxin domain|nr:multicopper oxidase domain-containing protein [Cyanosarcina radialis HA8281-LM2]